MPDRDPGVRIACAGDGKGARGVAERRKGNGTTQILQCSFCGKTQREVKKLIAGPTAYICDECVALCNDIIAEDSGGEAQPARKLLPSPRRSARSSTST